MCPDEKNKIPSTDRLLKQSLSAIHQSGFPLYHVLKVSTTALLTTELFGMKLFYKVNVSCIILLFWIYATILFLGSRIPFVIRRFEMSKAMLGGFDFKAEGKREGES